jgi:nitrile hydratase
MNGVHDVGGMHGFGPIVREPDEPVFRAAWEGRVRAMMTQAEPALFRSAHGGRFAIEAVEPVRHLAASYWERWLAALELGLLARGLTTREELAARVAHFAAHPEAPLASPVDAARGPRGSVRRGAAGTTGASSTVVARGAAEPSSHRPPALPRYQTGEEVRTRDMNPAGHTRLPRYARGHRGEVVRVSPAAPVPDRVVGGLLPVPLPVYTVRFSARELWGPQGHPNDTVDVDVWESYLEPPDDPGQPEPLEPSRAADHDGLPDGDPEPAGELSRYGAINAAGPWWNGGLLPPPAALARALESLLVELGLADSAAVDERVAQLERAGAVAPPPAARLVTRAWRDGAFRERLLADANAAAAEVGIQAAQPTVVLEDSGRVHHVVVCTLCSCMNLLIGRKPGWYTSLAYRASVVRGPRAVLRELGLALPEDVAVRVQDTTAETRYLVLPRRPAGSERYGEEQLAALVTAEALLGVAVARPA